MAKEKYLYTMKRRLIKKIKIGKRYYRVYLCEELEENNKPCDGYVDYDRRNIYVLKTKNKKEILIHEITHVFLQEISRIKRIKNKKMIKTLRSDELFIESLSYLIMQNFKLNKEFKFF